MSFATDWVQRERAAQELREMQERLEAHELELEESSALWKRYDDALDAINSREEELPPDVLYRVDRFLCAVRRFLDAGGFKEALLILLRVEELLAQR